MYGFWDSSRIVGLNVGTKACSNKKGRGPSTSVSHNLTLVGGISLNQPLPMYFPPTRDEKTEAGLLTGL